MSEEWSTVGANARVIKAAQRLVNVEIGARHNPDGYGMSTIYDRDHGAAMDELIAAVRSHDNPPPAVPKPPRGKRKKECPRCEGSGRDPGDYLPEPCGDCGGSGWAN